MLHALLDSLQDSLPCELDAPGFSSNSLTTVAGSVASSKAVLSVLTSSSKVFRSHFGSSLLLVIHRLSYDFLERKFSPSGSTQHVCDGEKWAVICWDVVNKKSAETVQDVIEKRCYLAVDYVTKLTSIAETDQYKTHLPPDGNIITVGAKNM